MGAPTTRLVLVAGLLALTACQQQSPAGATAPSAVPATSAPTATPSQTVIAINDITGTTPTLRLVTLDGQQVASTPLAPDASVAGAGGDVAMFVEARGTLKALRLNGSVMSLGTLTGRNGPVAVSPTGGAWMWATLSGAAGNYSSSIVLSTRGGSDRALTTRSSPLLGFWPYRWTPGGPVYADQRMGIDWHSPFGPPVGASWRVDTQSGQVSSLLPDTCQIADLAADGTIACFPSATPFSASRSIRLQPPGGQPRDFPLTSPTFDQWGAVSFKPGSTVTVLAIGSGTVVSPGPPTDHPLQIQLLNAATGALAPLGPAGLEPADGSWAWLHDGSLLAYRQVGVSGGAPGVYAVAPDGSTRRVYPSGIPIGVLTGPPGPGA